MIKTFVKFLSHKVRIRNNEPHPWHKERYRQQEKWRERRRRNRGYHSYATSSRMRRGEKSIKKRDHTQTRKADPQISNTSIYHSLDQSFISLSCFTISLGTSSNRTIVGIGSNTSRSNTCITQTIELLAWSRCICILL